MIIIKLKGGLGNQLFQYALGRSLESRGRKVKYNILTSDDRPFRLDLFNTKIELVSDDEIRAMEKKNNTIVKRLQNHSIWSKYKWISKIFRALIIAIDFLIYIKDEYIEERAFFDPRIFYLDDRFLDGYWANPKYFNRIRNELIKEIVLKDELICAKYRYYNKMIKASNASVSIHVRRGDYALFQNILSFDYYRKAIDFLKSKYAWAFTFFIFSDDLDWVKNHFQFLDDKIFIEDMGNITDCLEFQLMGECKINIIANSTFSWWASWLNNDPDKIILAPKKWYKSETEQKRLGSKRDELFTGMTLIPF